MEPKKVHIRRTCGATGKMLMAGEKYKAVERPAAEDEISIRDAKILVRNDKARWDDPEPEVVEQIPETPIEKTRPDVTATHKEPPKPKRKSRPKKTKTAE